MTDLLADPVHRLNLVLEGLMPQPSVREQSLWRAGLKPLLVASGRPIPSGLELELGLAGLDVGTNLPVDVMARCGQCTIIFECGPWDEQRTRTLLASAGHGDPGALVVWVVADSERLEMEDTTRAAGEWLRRRRLPCGVAAVAGVVEAEAGTSLVVGDDLAPVLGVKAGRVHLSSGDHNALLYRVICPSHARVAHCRRAAVECWRGGLLGLVSVSHPPTVLEFDHDWPLQEAGVSGNWRPDMVGRVRALARRSVDSLVRGVSRRQVRGASSQPGGGWTMAVPDLAVRAVIIDAVLAWDGEDVIDAEDPAPDLFGW